MGRSLELSPPVNGSAGSNTKHGPGRFLQLEHQRRPGVVVLLRFSTRYEGQAIVARGGDFKFATKFSKWDPKCHRATMKTAVAQLLLLVACGASATAARIPIVPKALALRGGSLDTPEGKFLAVSGTFATMNGIAILVAPDKALEMLVPGAELKESDPTVTNTLGVCMIAWGMAKFTSIRTSTEKQFSQGNLLPMALSTALIATVSVPGAALQLLFCAGYSYFGFLKK